MPYAPSQTLKHYYGFSGFRPGQKEIIDAILSGRDALCLLPTGGGKSLCYAIPALCLPGTTLVISPLIALMEDQVRALHARGIPAACLHAALPKRAKQAAISALQAGRLKLLYISPERLASPDFSALIKDVPVPLLAVDEAHCISQWGHEFRPPYRKIARFLYLPGRKAARPIVAAFTASATPQVMRDICENLTLQDPYIYRGSFDRPNLDFLLRQTRPPAASDEGSADAYRQLLFFLQAHKRQCGIIYCRMRRRTQTLAKQLCAAGYPAVSYHAGLPAKERTEAEAAWLQGRVPLIVTTNAFGMGVDKADVRFVVHYGMPPDLESYYQEAGRAGRDGAKAECLLLPLATDMKLLRVFRRQLQTQFARDAFDARLRAMLLYAGGWTCLRGQLLRYFEGTSPAEKSFPSRHPCGRCSVCRGDVQAYALSPPGVMDAGLYTELRAKRRQLAKERGIASKKIAGNRLLQDLATARPKTLLQLLMTGVCPLRFLLCYATIFLDEIRLFCALRGERPPR